MTDGCPIPLEQLVAYWADELEPADVDRIDEHVFGCAGCASEHAAVARLVVALRGAIPPVVTEAQVQALRSRGLTIEDNLFAPDERKTALFRPGVDILLHRLGGLDLARATHVRLVVRRESTGDLMMEDDAVPFDRDRGEVLIACQRHFTDMPPDILFEVHVRDDAGHTTSTRYLVPHELG